MTTPQNNKPLPVSSTARQERLRRYARAGAGAAVLAGTVTTANSDVVFINFNNQVFQDTTANDGVSTFLPIDVNNDAVTDLRLRHRYSYSSASSFVFLAGVRGPVSGSVDVVGLHPNAFFYPSRLPAGATIGPAAAFITLTGDTNNGDMASQLGYAGSQWDSANGVSGFLGIRFTIGGQPHYGYVELTVSGLSDQIPYRFTIAGVAYETNANVAITAGDRGAIPEPATVSLLALGAAGLVALRRHNATKAKSA